jgi:starch phosphorylase
VGLMERVLPRHLQIIYEINRRFLDHVRSLYVSEEDMKIRNLSLVEEGAEKRVRMANLAIVGSHSVNGVSEIHTGLLKHELFSDFHELWPERFNNKTNGITQRRWLKACNPDLAELITTRIGDGWITDLMELKKLVPLADSEELQKAWLEVKAKNKKRLSEYIRHRNGVTVSPGALFDCQVKRFHEYKRQLLNALHIVHLYNRIKEGVAEGTAPRVCIFAGKAAPGYWTAKLVIKLINAVADVVNHDPDVRNRLKVVFLANYDVSLAERIIPAADLSEQISTAGTEASGTGNMKFALNGALTVGTLDGANIEMLQETGEENFFPFGLTIEQSGFLRISGYNPWEYYEGNPHLKRALDLISSGFFAPEEPALFEPLVDSLLHGGDPYLLLADFADYLRCQEEVDAAFKNRRRWARMSILNVAHMGRFTSDRTIREYARDIWHVEPITVEAPPKRPCRDKPLT